MLVVINSLHMIGKEEKVEDLKTMTVTRKEVNPEPSDRFSEILEVKLDEANGAEVLWFHGKIGTTRIKVIGDTGAAANCCGGQIYTLIMDKKLNPKWIQKDIKTRVLGANGAALEVLGEIEITLTLNKRTSQLGLC